MNNGRVKVQYHHQKFKMYWFILKSNSPLQSGLVAFLRHRRQRHAISTSEVINVSGLLMAANIISMKSTFDSNDFQEI